MHSIKPKAYPCLDVIVTSHLGFALQNSLQLDPTQTTRRGRGPSPLQRIISGAPLKEAASIV